MDSRNPLTAGEIEDLKEEIRTMPHKEFFGENLQPLVDDHARLLSLLTPPPDEAVREAVNENRLHEAEQRVQQNSFSICARHDLEQELRIALASLRAVQTPRLTPEQVEAAFREGYGLGNDDGRNIDVFCHIKQHNPESDPDFAWEHSEARRAAFPEAFAGEVGNE